jgi:hypothetical protein
LFERLGKLLQEVIELLCVHLHFLLKTLDLDVLFREETLKFHLNYVFEGLNNLLNKINWETDEQAVCKMENRLREERDSRESRRQELLALP